MFPYDPFVLAKMFVDARGYQEKCGLLFGQYITRLSRSHGVLSERVVNSLTHVGDMGLIDEYQLKGMKEIMNKMRSGVTTTVWNNGYMEEEAEEAHTQSHPTSGGEGSTSHHAPPEWDAHTDYQGLQTEFH